jgi:uncharacterized RDD family membrane protein YckC
MNQNSLPDQPPSLRRRLAAISYDAVLLAAIFMLASLPFVTYAAGPPAGTLLRISFQLYLALVAFLFFGWFWVRNGQTPGMLAWRLKLVQRDGAPVTWPLAATRFAAAFLSWTCLGLGFLWVLVDRDKLAWHDRMSGTRLRLLPKPSKTRRSTVTTQQPKRE